MAEKLKNLLQLIKDEQRRLIFAAAEGGQMPPGSTLVKIAQLELNIAAIENGMEDKALAR